MLAQVVCKRFIAIKIAEVKENHCAQQGLRIGIRDPLIETLPPLFKAQAPVRVARHDIAPAERETAGIKGAIHGLCKRQQSGAHRIRRSSAAIINKTVVLIGADGLFVPPFTAKDQPAPGSALQVML